MGKPDYKGSFEAMAVDLGAIIALLGFDSYPGVDPVLRKITDLLIRATQDLDPRGVTSTSHPALIALDKQCRDDVARALGLTPTAERGFAWCQLLDRVKVHVAQADAAKAAAVGDVERLDFMLNEWRKVVCELLPHDNFEVYVEEGFMGDKRYPGVRYSGEWSKGSPEALEIQREAIDAAILANRVQAGGDA